MDKFNKIVQDAKTKASQGHQQATKIKAQAVNGAVQISQSKLYKERIGKFIVDNKLPRTVLYVIVALKAGQIYDKFRYLVAINNIQAQMVVDHRQKVREAFGTLPRDQQVSFMIDKQTQKTGSIKVTDEDLMQDILTRRLLNMSLAEDGELQGDELVDLDI